MIPRFSRPEMAAIWSVENRYRIWIDIQVHACAAQEKSGAFPKGTADEIRKKASFDVARIDAIEKEVRHDVIAFLTNIGEGLGDHARYLHRGMTSSDMIDTGFAVQLRDAGNLLIDGIDAVLSALRAQILTHRDTPCIGRSHGIHAEPMTFGLKLASHYAAFARARRRMVSARDEVSTCAISGAVGTFATIDPQVEKYVAEKLGLAVEPVSTQVIPRDRHAMFFATLGVIASSVENLATEIRHLQRTEVGEAEESFARGQKGSSAMPHKKNPVLSENLTGLARLVRGYVMPALENVTLWHERDISHSAVERVIAPDATIAADFALHRLAGVVRDLAVHPERMKSNMESLKGLVFSQSVLLSLTEAGMPRDKAYGIVQTHAMKVWEEGADFLSLLQRDAVVAETLDKDVLQNLFDYDRYRRHISAIIDRALAA